MFCGFGQVNIIASQNLLVDHVNEICKLLNGDSFIRNAGKPGINI